MLDVPEAQQGDWIVRKEGDNLFLWERGTTWMTDMEAEHKTHRHAIEEARRRGGRVLTTGLGLGLFTHWCLEGNESIESVTIVERQLEVVNLVWPTLSARHGPRVILIMADAMTWQPTSRYSVIWHDFWETPHSEAAKKARAAVEPRYGEWCDWQGFWECD